MCPIFEINLNNNDSILFVYTLVFIQIINPLKSYIKLSLTLHVKIFSITLEDIIPAEVNIYHY